MPELFLLKWTCSGKEILWYQQYTIVSHFIKMNILSGDKSFFLPPGRNYLFFNIRTQTLVESG